MACVTGHSGAAVLNIDGARPGVIYAYVDEEVYAEIGDQLSERADTTEVIGPHPPRGEPWTASY
jgi:hypothetical protein